MSDTLMMLVAHTAEDAVRKLPADASLEDRARAAMTAARRHWMAPGEEVAFMGACEGLARTASEVEFERIEEDLKRLRRASALMGALKARVPVDWEGLAEEAEEVSQSPLGLRRIWLETAA